MGKELQQWQIAWSLNLSSGENIKGLMLLYTFKRTELVKIQNGGSYLLWEDLWLGRVKLSMP
jgi:hypothetical protein